MRTRARIVDRWLAATLAVAAIGLAACGGYTGGEVRTVTVPAVEQDTPATGDAILIETRITDAKAHTGEVLSGSVIGESAFCPGGKSSGGSDGALITSTFRCPDGSLKVSYSPMQQSLVQGAVWEVVSGTGSYEGLRGGGSMVARFGNIDPDEGRETFTGIVDK
jgi:hypothetical protein